MNDKTSIAQIGIVLTQLATHHETLGFRHCEIIDGYSGPTVALHLGAVWKGDLWQHSFPQRR